MANDGFLKDDRKIYVPPSEVHHFYRLIREGSMLESEFADVWNDSIQRSIEAAQHSVHPTLATSCENKHARYMQYGCVFCPDCDKPLGG